VTSDLTRGELDSDEVRGSATGAHKAVLNAISQLELVALALEPYVIAPPVCDEQEERHEREAA
jgi:hypothetical protein